MRSFAGIAVTLAAVFAMLSAACAAADDAAYLRLEKQYHTKCLGLYETPLADGRFVYHSDGLPRNNGFTRLDVLSGDCMRVASLPASDFMPRAVSADYLLANDGLYNRHSIYRKSDWKRFGTIRLKDPLAASAISGDLLFVLQNVNLGDGHLEINTFSLPDFKLKRTRVLGYRGYRALAFDRSFVLSDKGNLAIYDDDSGETRQTSFPVSLSGFEILPDGARAAIGCGADPRLVGGDTVMVHTTCHAYTLFDLATLKPRYSIDIGDRAVFAKAFVSGELLYVLAESTAAPRDYKGGVHDDIQVLNRQTGQNIVSPPPPLVSDEYTDVFQVEDRLVWAVFDQSAGDFRIEVYRMQSRLPGRD